jgi:SAM-dependent methyltransferase
MPNPMVDTNRAFWGELARIHTTRRSTYYDLDTFAAGSLSLRPLERAEVGDVTNKSLLHLQCHFGLDTLSFARLGARVTGVDFSPDAIEHARTLATTHALTADFVCADLDDPALSLGTFDIVFTSFGTTIWLPDLDRWAALIARSLTPGGFFYIADGHPFSMCLDPDLRVAESYFRQGPFTYDGGPDYAVPDAIVTAASYEWPHTLGDIITALTTAGLRIAFLHEHAFADYPFAPNLARSDDGYYRPPPDAPQIPRIFSIKATR